SVKLLVRMIAACGHWALNFHIGTHTAPKQKGSPMSRGILSRRGFLQRSTLALAAAGLPTWFAREVVAGEDEKNSQKADQSAIKVGIIGIGSNGKGSKGSPHQSRARQLIGDVRGLKRDNIRFTAVCDVDGRHLEEGVADLKKLGHDVKAYKDFRELNDSK